MAGLPLVGDEFASYRVRSVLGRGGMSVVYQAENLRLSNVIALKDVWYGLPSVRAMQQTDEQVRLLQRVVTMCIKEYYRELPA